MSPLSNAEKQARHRKKEELQKFAERCIRDGEMMFVSGVQSTAIKAQIMQMANLPSGWTNDDYVLAVKRIEQLRWDLIDRPNDLDNDVWATLDIKGQFKKKTNSVKSQGDIDKSIQDTRNLAAHLISALELTDLSSGERAAALVEALRHVGRALANERPLRQSDANTICLATLPSHYERPDWFSEAFAKYMAGRLGNSEVRERLGKNIKKYIGV